MLDFMPPPLFADIIQLIFLIVFILFSILGQFFKEKPPQPKARNRAPRPEGPQPPRSLEAEIEDFMRQVTGAAEPKNRTRQDEVVEAEVVERERFSQRPTTQRPIEAARSASQGSQGAASGPQRPPTGAGQSGSLRNRESVGKHVRDHIQTGGVESHDSGLAATIENRDEAMESHLAEIFDHQLGDLASRTRISDSDSVSSKSSITTRKEHMVMGIPIAELLTSRNEIRKAIILNEILTRPEDRW